MDTTLNTLILEPHIHRNYSTQMCTRLDGWALGCLYQQLSYGTLAKEDNGVSSHTFAPCDLPLSVGGSLRDTGECSGVEARHTERCVSVQRHNYFMRPVVSALHLKATGLTEMQPPGVKRDTFQVTIRGTESESKRERTS